MKHGGHIRDVANVPIGNIPVEWKMFEKSRHIGNARDIDVVQIAVGPAFLHFDGDLRLQLRGCGDDNGAERSRVHPTIIAGILLP